MILPRATNSAGKEIFHARHLAMHRGYPTQIWITTFNHFLLGRRALTEFLLTITTTA
jgi:hypothetical protein